MQRSAALGLVPITQRAQGYPHGDCVRAAYASLLGLPLEVVPRFDPASLRPGEDQAERESAWLASLSLPWAPYGLRLDETAVAPEENLPQHVLDETPPIEHLMSGLSPRGLYHRVVGWGGRLLWDPHPSRDGLLTVYSVALVVPR